MYTPTLYHKFLRVSALVVGLVLLFQSTSTVTSSPLLSDARTYLANAVSVTVGVEPTELNMITAGLTKRSTELDAREAALREREINARATDGGDSSLVFSNYVLSTLLLLLLVLIVMNYIFDFIRARGLKKYA